MIVLAEWGLAGSRALAPEVDVLVVVDVLSFSTAVAVAVDRGAQVWPHPGEAGAGELASSVGALLAGSRSSGVGPTLSPASLVSIEPGTRLVLPSPNGSAIAHSAAEAGVVVVAGCLRNASAVASHVRAAGRVGLVAAGERWPDGSLRPAYEDWVGIGAVAAALVREDPSVALAPEAEAAALAFRSRRPLEECPSGRELVEGGFAEDVRLAAEVDVSAVVPVLVDGCFVDVSGALRG